MFLNRLLLASSNIIASSKRAFEYIGEQTEDFPLMFKVSAAALPVFAISGASVWALDYLHSRFSPDSLSAKLISIPLTILSVPFAISTLLMSPVLVAGIAAFYIFIVFAVLFSPLILVVSAMLPDSVSWKKKLKY